MYISRYLIIPIVIIASFIAAPQYKAFSLEHIPFFATNESSEDVTICCIGPWFRQICGDQGQCTIPANAVSDNFYSADIDIFSPYGTWWCCLVTDTPLSNCGEGPRSGCNGTGSFSISKDDTSVNLTISTERMTVDLSNDSNTSTVQAVLGDDNTRGKRKDRDTWSFQGTEGETVTIKLEIDYDAGHNAGQATLMLKNKDSTMESSTDTLPIEISSMLPTDGEYKLVVQQNNIPSEVRFKGKYFLSVQSSIGNVQEIVASEDVEY